MMNIIMLLLEAMAMMVCLHRLYDDKIEFSVSTMAMVLCHIIYLFELSINHMNRLHSLLIYAVYIIYCVNKFRISYIRATIGMCLCIIVMTVFQFCVLIVVSVFPFKEDIRAVLINVIVLIICILGISKCRLSSLEKWIAVRAKIKYLIMGFVIILIGMIIYQNKVMEGIQVELYIYAIPAVCISMVMAEKWINYQSKSEMLESELRAKNRFQLSYNKMLKDMRIRQHNFNNQIQTIIGTHYVYKTYEDLVRVQGELCENLKKDNKYNKLLWLGSNIISGFLFVKFQEIEGKGIDVELKVNSGMLVIGIPECILIEAIGILLDNAAEAVGNRSDSEIIKMTVLQNDNVYSIKIANRTQYVPYEEIDSWFQLGKSSKANDRGIGLYRVKQICSENDCNLLVHNISCENENWIEFILEVKGVS